MTHLTFADSVVIARPPRAVYDLVTDISRMGDWSPVCRACWWDDGAGPQAGAWFTGRNELNGRVWETRSQVAAAEPGREFTFLVAGGWVRWTYRFEAAGQGTGTVLTEEWEFRPMGIAGFRERYGDEAQAQIDQRAALAREGIPVTLAAIKRAAEAD
jgi:uncharacterized protein YndB with AHSA1/START domain